ncbi:MAG: CapA family protein [Proteobacteria bacterium]|nr:CapA family protein [Pseudomonadota bacterium]
MWLWIALAVALAGAYEDGVAALKDNRPADALVYLQQAVAEDELSAQAHWELGWAHWSLENFEFAAREWTRVRELDPNRSELEHWLTAAETKVALVNGTEEPELPPAEIPLEPGEGRITFAAAGDTMMGSDLKRGTAGLPPGNGEVIFEDTAPIFKAADIAFVNLEGPLADGLPSRKCRPDSTACYAFRTPTKYAAALTYAGIDVASLANNHAMDLGGMGQESTMKVLDEVGIAHAGRLGDQALLEVNGVKVVFLAAHVGNCCLNINYMGELVRAVRLADQEADLVVLSFHGGAEGTGAQHVPGKLEIAYGEKRGDVKKAARAAVDAGADLVLGHGPHVLRAMEVYKGRLIAYSLANYCGYNQFGTRGATGYTVILSAELADNGVLVSAKLTPLKHGQSSVPHPDTEGEALRLVRELSAADFPETGVKVADDGTLSW